YLERAKLTVQQIKERLRDLQRLPPLSPVADKVDLTERLVFLDIVMMVARSGVHTLEDLGGGRAPKPADPQVERFWRDTGWDPALRLANRWYDRLAAPMRLKDARARREQLYKLEIEIKELKASLANQGEQMKAILGAKDAARVKGKYLGGILVGLLVPAVS